MDGAASSAAAETIAAQLLDRALAQIRSGKARGELRARAWRVGPWRIEQRHLGPVLEPLFHPAWEHLTSVEPGEADLVVYCCDAESTGLDLGRLPWRGDEFRPSGDVGTLEGSKLRALWDRQGHSLHLLDRRRRIGLFCIQSPGHYRSWERSLPLRHFLHWQATTEDVQLMHAGAVGTAAGGALLLGRSGAGKSTTTLACLGSPLGIAGDDIVLVEPGVRTIVHSVSATAKLARGSMQRFPRLAHWDDNPLHGPDEKAIFFPERILPGSVIRSFPLKALLMLEVASGADTRVEGVSAGAALQVAAPNTLFLFPGDRVTAFRRIADLAKRIPCFRLSTGQDLARIPERIGQLLDRL